MVDAGRAVVGIVLPACIARTHHQLQRVGQRKPRRRIGTALLGAGDRHALARGSEVGIRVVSGPLEEIADVRQVAMRVVEVVRPIVRVGQADHQFVFAPERAERARGVDIQIVLATALETLVGIGNQPLPRLPVRRAEDVEQRGVRVGLAVAGHRMQLPAVVEAVLEVDERGLRGVVPVGPVGRRRETARPMNETAIRVQHGVRAPRDARGPRLLPVVAHAQRRVLVQVGVDDAIGHVLLAVIAVDV